LSCTVSADPWPTFVADAARHYDRPATGRIHADMAT
jgi:hypothetical protein